MRFDLDATHCFCGSHKVSVKLFRQFIINFDLFYTGPKMHMLSDTCEKGGGKMKMRTKCTFPEFDYVETHFKHV